MFLLFLSAAQAKDKTFTIVIDPGHGGRDPGAVGATVNEKTINLAVALKLGNLITSKHPDVRVLYTRSKDVFIDLDERANIANRNKADLFISLHTNAVKKGNTVSGTETYTMGLARTDENLEVAMRENAAILLEDNYLQKYEGFDPTSSESYIIFEFMQNKHVEQSISLASEIQKAFKSARRTDRGVRQAGFLVLRKTSMPSVLVELGYISNRDEERFMKSAAGQQSLATAVYNAFAKYKWDHDRKLGALSDSAPPPVYLATTSDEPVYIISDEPVYTASASGVKPPPPGSEAAIRLQRESAARAAAQPQQQTAGKATSKTAASKQTPAKSATTASASKPAAKGKVIYKIQILTSDKKLAVNSKQFKGYKQISFYQEKGLYKYTYGESANLDDIKKLRRQVAKDFKDAFIVAFQDGRKIKYN